jgi:hypothetical protein
MNRMQNAPARDGPGASYLRVYEGLSLRRAYLRGSA